MRNQIPVSVVIPCFNQGRFIREAIESVERCDKQIYELIIVNDGSTDLHTQQVMQQLDAEGYQIIDQANQGLASARNNGIRAARGEYILPLDADNRIRPNYIYKSASVLDTDPRVSVVYGKAEYFGDSLDRPDRVVSEFDIHRLLYENFIDACAVFRKSAWEECGGYDTNMPAQGLEDWDFWISLGARGHRFFFINEVLFDYRMRHDSMTQDLARSQRYDEVIQYMNKKHPILDLYQQSREHKKRLRDLETFVGRIQSNRLFKMYHWLKYLGRA
jgi:glycosyltransferase involved in cell wall biosynthesis